VFHLRLRGCRVPRLVPGGRLQGKAYECLGATEQVRDLGERQTLVRLAAPYVKLADHAEHWGRKPDHITGSLASLDLARVRSF
jgi:hypothetical protein